jgi:hypothetical protein
VASALRRKNRYAHSEANATKQNGEGTSRFLSCHAQSLFTQQLKKGRAAVCFSTEKPAIW